MHPLCVPIRYHVLGIQTTLTDKVPNFRLGVGRRKHRKFHCHNHNGEYLWDINELKTCRSPSKEAQVLMTSKYQLSRGTINTVCRRARGEERGVR